MSDFFAGIICAVIIVAIGVLIFGMGEDHVYREIQSRCKNETWFVIRGERFECRLVKA